MQIIINKANPNLSGFDKEFITLGTNSKTLKEAISKINADKEYQDCIIEEYSQDMLDYLLAFVEETV